ncbi:Rhs-family protein, partial [Salmonella enterica subsp. enterica serovar Senftenberg str. 604314]
DAAANLLDRRQGETAQAGAGSVVPFNRITSYRGLHYRYDEYGRVVEKRGRNGTQHYRWDAEHRLTEVAVIRGEHRTALRVRVRRAGQAGGEAR